jgi:hypothetical protein
MSSSSLYSDSSRHKKTFDVVPYVDPIQCMWLCSVLVAHSSASSSSAHVYRFKSNLLMASAHGCDCTLSNCGSLSTLATFTHGCDHSPSTSTTLVPPTCEGCRPMLTPLVASTHVREFLLSTCHSMSTLVASAHDFVRSTSRCMSFSLLSSTLHVSSMGPSERSSFVQGSTLTSSIVSLTAHEIVQLWCLLDAWDSSPTGSAWCATGFSSTERPPSTHSGTSTWIYGTDVSFHTTLLLYFYLRLTYWVSCLCSYYWWYSSPTLV